MSKLRDWHSTRPKDGDSVTEIKNVRVNGSSSAVKTATKVKNRRLIMSDHDTDPKEQPEQTTKVL
ncbi:MAG: PhnA domain-containing protein [Burkholderiaceae bacterium]